MDLKHLREKITRELAQDYPEMANATVRMVPLEHPPRGVAPVLGPTGRRLRWFQWVGEVDLEGPEGTRFRRRMVVCSDELGNHKSVARSR
ncbi:MAG: hypothetical protein ABIN58_11835 [candidate division WOR-3 bacterium]